MEGCTLLFWKPGPNIKLSAPEIAQELMWGEDVEGLIDLPVREILDRLKADFPQHEEQAGAFLGRGAAGQFEATWTWQFVRVTCRDLTVADRERVIDAIESFDCMAFDPQISN
jgi:hypothetical protein